MANVFLGNMDSMSHESSMDMIVSPKWLVNYEEVLAKELKAYKSIDSFKPKEDVPELKLNALGLEMTKNKNLWMTSRNHRRIAQRVALDHLVKALIPMKAEEKKLHEAWEKAGSPKDKDNEEKAAVTKIASKVQSMEERIQRQSFWAVKLFNKGERRIWPAFWERDTRR
jgi:hypothetical protein